jgi:hypothetical protein
MEPRRPACLHSGKPERVPVGNAPTLDPEPHVHSRARPHVRWQTALSESLWVAAIVVAARLAAIMAGSWAGCAASGVRPEVARRFWLSMVTQAGVALGLARIAGAHFPGWGHHFQTLMMAIIMINMLVRPGP